jgi:hypothetical protein
MNFFKVKTVCIARCKNEMVNIERWIESLSFIDLFCITDNGSTDGTYEYLKKIDNVLVTRVEGFDEGRDFQILLNMAKAHQPEWILKIDCDEFFMDEIRNKINSLLNQKEYDAIMFRKISKHYSVDQDHCLLTREYRNGGVYFARNNKNLSILNKKIHVGGFIFHGRCAISSALIEHNWISSNEDAITRFETYSEVDSSKVYKVRNIVDKSLFVPVKDVYGNKYKTLRSYGVDLLDANRKKIMIEKAIKNKTFFVKTLKNFIFKIILFFHIDSIYIRLKSNL